MPEGSRAGMAREARNESSTKCVERNETRNESSTKREEGNESAQKRETLPFLASVMPSVWHAVCNKKEELNNPGL